MNSTIPWTEWQMWQGDGKQTVFNIEEEVSEIYGLFEVSDFQDSGHPVYDWWLPTKGKLWDGCYRTENQQLIFLEPPQHGVFFQLFYK
jgi:hypothetical protein